MNELNQPDTTALKHGFQIRDKHMDQSRTVVFRPTASFQQVLPSQIANMIMTSLSMSLLFAGYHLHDWQLWIGCVLIMGWVIYTLPSKSSLQLHLSKQGIHFFPQPKAGLPRLKNVDFAQINQIKIIENNSIWQSRRDRQTLIYVLSHRQPAEKRPQMLILKLQDWQSDQGHSLITVLQKQFAGRVQQYVQTSILEPIQILDPEDEHPLDLDLGRWAGLAILSSLASMIVGFILFFFNPFESLTWGDYPQLLKGIAVVIAVILAGLFWWQPIKKLAKLTNIIFVIPIFTAANIFLIHSAGMAVADAWQPNQHIQMTLIKQTKHADQWSTAQGWHVYCPRTAQNIGDQRMARIQHSILGVVRMKLTRFCTP